MTRLGKQPEVARPIKSSQRQQPAGGSAKRFPAVAAKPRGASKRAGVKKNQPLIRPQPVYEPKPLSKCSDQQPRHAVYKSELTEERKWLVEQMQEIGYGRIKRLVIVNGQPQINPPPQEYRDERLAEQNNHRGEIYLDDFVLAEQITTLFEECDRIDNGVILSLEVRDGLPFALALTKPKAIPHRPDVKSSKSLTCPKHVYEQVLWLFSGNDEIAQEWIHRRAPDLHWKTPLEAAQTEEGAEEVIKLVGRIAHGVIA